MKKKEKVGRTTVIQYTVEREYLSKYSCKEFMKRVIKSHMNHHEVSDVTTR